MAALAASLTLTPTPLTRDAIIALVAGAASVAFRQVFPNIGLTSQQISAIVHGEFAKWTQSLPVTPIPPVNTSAPVTTPVEPTSVTLTETAVPVQPTAPVEAPATP